MSITLFKQELDVWEPGEHNGTFRGNNLAFITATEALSYWKTDTFVKEIHRKITLLTEFTHEVVKKYPN